ncbi:UNKNOWN [Stylonychia lemnae]|uniref:GAF domain-containing protein n=1 Tax=Stylonychia lemnae TaxID=5949 RepID=A0A078A886_STYLE|nr:UNKNOWN [Stylonychia lemnae]|eukprot:CDW78434.1 UNKNOWN [Stylonychia lemnae]
MRSFNTGQSSYGLEAAQIVLQQTRNNNREIKIEPVLIKRESRQHGANNPLDSQFYSAKYQSMNDQASSRLDTANLQSHENFKNPNLSPSIYKTMDLVKDKLDTEITLPKEYQDMVTQLQEYQKQLINKQYQQNYGSGIEGISNIQKIYVINNGERNQVKLPSLTMNKSVNDEVISSQNKLTERNSSHLRLGGFKKSLSIIDELPIKSMRSKKQSTTNEQYQDKFSQVQSELNISQNSSIFQTPSNVSSDQIMQHFVSKTQRLLPQSMRETYQLKKKAQTHQRELIEKIKICEQQIKKAQERNKKAKIALQFQKKEIEYLNNQKHQNESRQNLITNILSHRGSQALIETASIDQMQSVTNLSLPIDSQSRLKSSSSIFAGIEQMQSQASLLTNNSLRAISVYENLIVEDLSKDLMKAKQKVINATLNKDSILPLVEALREENRQLRKTVQRYQIMARELNNKLSINLDNGNRISSLERSQMMIKVLEETLDIDKKLQIDGRTRDGKFMNIQDQNNSSFQMTMKTTPIRSPSEQTMNEPFIKSLNQTNIIQVDKAQNSLNVTNMKHKEHSSLMEVGQFDVCKATLDCESCALFVCDPKLELVYINPIRKERAHLLKRTFIGPDQYYLIFSSEKDDAVLMGSFDSTGKLIFGIQVMKPNQHQEQQQNSSQHHHNNGEKEKKRSIAPKVFGKLQILKLKFLAEFISKKAENIMLRYEATEKEKKILQILKCCDQIIKKRTHKDIILTMRRELANLYEFDLCQVFLYDPLTESDSNAKADYNVDTIIRFPTSLGLTGIACLDRILIYSNDVENDLRFNSDLDNIMGINKIKNMMVTEFSAVESDQGKEQDPVGVIQLINKKGIEPLNEFDSAMVNALRLFLGTCVDNITIVNYSVKVTLSVSQELSGINKTMTDREEKTLDSKMNFEIFMKTLIQMQRFLEVLQKPHLQNPQKNVKQ